MTLIPALILAAGLNAAVSSPPPATHAVHAEARMNRMVAAAAPALHHRAVSRAIADGTQRLGTEIAHELALTRVKPAQTSAAHARIVLHLPAAKSAASLKADPIPLFPKLVAPATKVGSGGTAASARATPAAPRPHLSTMIVGGVLAGFLALAGLAATAFSRLTS